MRALIIAIGVVIGTSFVAGCGQTSSSTLAPSAVVSTAAGGRAQTAQPTQNLGGRPPSQPWSAGWDVFTEPLDYTSNNSTVTWNQPGSTSNLVITYHLAGARPNWNYQVGVHLFDRCDPAFGQYTSNIPCSRPATRQNTTRNVQAFDLGSIPTDSLGNGGGAFPVLKIARGDYELEFDVRAGVGCPADPGECNVVFQSPGPFGVGTIKVSIP
jgi:hypothetical protein